MIKLLRYKWLLKRGYRISVYVRITMTDDLFCNPPVTYNCGSRLEMRKGLRKKSIRFRNMEVDELKIALEEL
jgi:hypothetical protein